MTFRSRIMVAFLLAAMVPLVALVIFMRAEMTRRLTAQYERRVESMIGVIEEDLSQQGRSIALTLDRLGAAAADDNRFRRAAVDQDPNERAYLLDFAARAMRMTNLSMLQIQDEDGRIMSSGHFRNEYDRLEPGLPALLAAAPGATALIDVRAADMPFLALGHADSLWMGGRLFTLVGGVTVGPAFLSRLARGGELGVSLVGPIGRALVGDTLVAADEATGAIVRGLEVPYIDGGRAEILHATFSVSHDLSALHALRASFDRWILVVVIVTIAAAAALVVWLSSRMSRPLAALAEKTSRIDLDRLDVDFDTDRGDEIGALSRLMAAMTSRLRASATRIRDAERRATRGELARQVNHDIKNGLTPIRNTFRHLSQVGREEPARLGEVYAEREAALRSSIDYLETLATNYARVASPSGERRDCDVNDIVRRVAADAGVEARLGERAIVTGDPVSIRRVVENLVSNAVEAVGKRTRGDVVLTTQNDEGAVRIVIADTGAGIPKEQIGAIFNDFYTTKDDGTGLGLSIVRRLVMDLGGKVSVESEEGSGSRFTVELPGAK